MQILQFIVRGSVVVALLSACSGETPTGVGASAPRYTGGGYIGAGRQEASEASTEPVRNGSGYLGNGGRSYDASGGGGFIGAGRSTDAGGPMSSESGLTDNGHGFGSGN